MTNLTKLSNRQLIEKLFNQIENELNFHIADKYYNDTYFIIGGEKDSICNFHIKELPGFLFGIWSTTRFDSISNCIKSDKITWADSFRIPWKSELILFTQWEKCLDKFKPSSSSFVTGLYRQNYISDNDELESFDLYEVERLFNFIKHHPIRAVYYTNCRCESIYDQASNIRIIKSFIYDIYFYYKDKLKKLFQFKKCEYAAKKLCKKLTQYSSLIYDAGPDWSSRVHIKIKLHNIYNKGYKCKEDKLIDKFVAKYWNNIDLDFYNYELDENSTIQDIQNDAKNRKLFDELFDMKQNNLFDKLLFKKI